MPSCSRIAHQLHDTNCYVNEIVIECSTFVAIYQIAALQNPWRWENSLFSARWAEWSGGGETRSEFIHSLE